MRALKTSKERPRRYRRYSIILLFISYFNVSPVPTECYSGVGVVARRFRYKNRAELRWRVLIVFGRKIYKYILVCYAFSIHRERIVLPRLGSTREYVHIVCMYNIMCAPRLSLTVGNGKGAVLYVEGCIVVEPAECVGWLWREILYTYNIIIIII